MLIWDRVPGPRRPGLKAGTLLLLIDRRSEGTAFPREGATAPRSRPGALQRSWTHPSLTSWAEVGGARFPRRTRVVDEETATWLILPVVICLSQRLSHACVSINSFVL